MLLTASSRPIVILSLPARSNSWLSASTMSRACSAVASGVADGAGAATTTGSFTAATGGGATGSGAAGACAGAPNRLLPQFEQNASPAGLLAPHDGQICSPAAAGAEASTGAWAGAAVATGADAFSGSPHSSQNAEPSGLS